MSKIIFRIFLFAILASLIYFLFVISDSNACEEPLQYSLGNIDARFELTDDDIINIAFAVEQIWEEPVNLDLFEYNAEAPFKINFVFDQRQQAVIETKKLEEGRIKLEALVEASESQYDYLLILYKQKLLLHNNSVELYEKRLASYNLRVNRWNRRGGAPENIYQNLQEEAQELESLASQLEQEMADINLLVDRINALAVSNNQLISRHNINVQTYNSKFGQGKEFDQGNFTGDEINVYQFEGIADLKLVLAHELGHMLGIDHVERSSSLMYYLMDNQNLSSLQLTQEDILALERVCNLN